ncbi:MAG: oxidoreductase [Nocardioides sp.]
MSVDLMALVRSRAGLQTAFASARDSLDVALRDRGWRRTTPEQTATALRLGAEASAALAIEEGETEASASAAALRVSVMVLGQTPRFRDTPLQALAAIHAAALDPAEDPGAERGRPADSDAADRLQRLAALLRAGQDVPALIVAAVVHAEIAGGRLFARHSGIVARGAERLTLVSRGIDPASVLVPEAGHRQLSSEYRAAIAAYRGDAGLGGSGAGAWLEYAACAYGSSASVGGRP